MGQRLTGMTVAAERAFRSRRRGFVSPSTAKSGAWLSELLPHTARIADELCFIKSMHTEAINHDPAVTFFHDRGPARRPAQHRARGSPTAWAARTQTCRPLWP